MTEEQLRQLVREAVARHLNRGSLVGSEPAATVSHPSHGLLPLAPGGNDGACVIEPAVRCVHCGYCQSFGH
jgi:hypothetical protein